MAYVYIQNYDQISSSSSLALFLFLDISGLPSSRNGMDALEAASAVATYPLTMDGFKRVSITILLRWHGLFAVWLGIFMCGIDAAIDLQNSHVLDVDLHADL